MTKNSLPTDEKLLFLYIAGFFDGEGCVSILKFQQKNRASPNYKLHAHIVQKYPSPLEAILERISVGKIYKMGACFQLQIVGIDCRDFLKKVEPYLILKKEQALLGIEYYDKTQWSKADGYRVSDDMNEKREWYYKRLQEMKGEQE